MLLVEGISDSGGAGGNGDIWSTVVRFLPLVLSAIAIVFTAVTIGINVRRSARDRLWSYLQLLVSAETSRARSTVGEAARWLEPRARARMVKLKEAEHNRLSIIGEPRLDAWKEEHARYRDAIFQLLWVVALAAPALDRGHPVHRWVVGGSTALYRAQVYQHLNLIVPDLYRAFDYWASTGDGSGSAGLADASLDALPKVQSHGIDGRIVLAEQRFSALVDDAPKDRDSP